jgi:Protein of unknown function (DUF2516)
VTIVNPLQLPVVDLFFWVLLLGAFVVETWAFIDVIIRPTAAFPAAGKQTKPLWLVILGVAFVIGLYGILTNIQLISLFPIAAFVVAAIYLVDVRPKVRSIKARPGTHQGPYGPW